ncbi:hypothetical protein [Alsobacter sp. SYSU BS001988]
MTAHARELYQSSNGDRWILVQTGDHVFVRHEANIASGGTVSHLEVDAFLSAGRGPEQQELLRLIGTLASTHAEPAKA